MSGSERLWYYLGQAAIGGWVGLFVVWFGNGISEHPHDATLKLIPYGPTASIVVVLICAAAGLAWAAYRRRKAMAGT